LANGFDCDQFEFSAKKKNQKSHDRRKKEMGAIRREKTKEMGGRERDGGAQKKIHKKI